eukprot:RCo014432
MTDELAVKALLAVEGKASEAGPPESAGVSMGDEEAFIGDDGAAAKEEGNGEEEEEEEGMPLDDAAAAEPDARVGVVAAEEGRGNPAPAAAFALRRDGEVIGTGVPEPDSADREAREGLE